MKSNCKIFFNLQGSHPVFLSSRLNSENRRIKTLKSSLDWFVSSSTTSREPRLKLYEFYCAECMLATAVTAAMLIKQSKQIPA